MDGPTGLDCRVGPGSCTEGHILEEYESANDSGAVRVIKLGKI